MYGINIMIEICHDLEPSRRVNLTYGVRNYPMIKAVISSSICKFWNLNTVYIFLYHPQEDVHLRRLEPSRRVNLTYGVRNYPMIKAVVRCSICKFWNLNTVYIFLYHPQEDVHL